MRSSLLSLMYTVVILVEEELQKIPQVGVNMANIFKEGSNIQPTEYIK